MLLLNFISRNNKRSLIKVRSAVAIVPKKWLLSYKLIFFKKKVCVRYGKWGSAAFKLRPKLGIQSREKYRLRRIRRKKNTHHFLVRIVAICNTDDQSNHTLSRQLSGETVGFFLSPGGQREESIRSSSCVNPPSLMAWPGWGGGGGESGFPCLSTVLG